MQFPEFERFHWVAKMGKLESPFSQKFSNTALLRNFSMVFKSFVNLFIIKIILCKMTWYVQISTWCETFISSLHIDFKHTRIHHDTETHLLWYFFLHLATHFLKMLFTGSLKHLKLLKRTTLCKICLFWFSSVQFMPIYNQSRGPLKISNFPP